MASFKQLPKGSIIGSGTYRFRHYGDESRLPAEYQEVEWIGSTGTQSIQVPFSVDYIGGYIKQKIMRTNSGKRGLIGAALHGSAAMAGAAGSYFGWNASGYWEMGGSSVSTILSSTTKFDDTKFEWTGRGSGKLTVNGTVATQRSGSGLYTFFNVFGGNTTYPVSCKQKEIEVYNSSGGTKKTAHLVPCYRKSDGAVGMYDIVGNAFYANIGTGSFTKGADVT